MMKTGHDFFSGRAWWVALLMLGASSGLRAADYEPLVYRDTSSNSLPYRLLQPLNYNPQQKYPLVVFFHGAGERGTDNDRQLIHGASLFLKPEYRQQYPCFVLAPQCPEKQQWVDMPWGDDAGTRPVQPSAAMQLALQTLETVLKGFSIDTNRLYVTGLSMGGYATWDCLTRFPERFAAAAPVCGGGDEKTVTEAVAKVPVWAFHSEDDEVVKVGRTRNLIQALRNAGGQPKYFEYFGLGHNSWSQAYAEPEFLPWMFAQRRGQPDAFGLKTPLPVLPAVAQWPATDDLFPGQDPLQKADWFQKLWRQRRLSWWLSREADQGAVVFLGDSIMQGWNSLAKDFPNLKLANRGISGDTTRGVRCRLKEDVLDLKPAAAVMLLGTNDLGLEGEPEDAAANLKEILNALKQSNPKLPIILCRVMPRGAVPGRFPEKIVKLNQLIDALAKDEVQITLCDTWSIFANEQGAAKPEEFPDLLHPNAAGYAKWVTALNPIFAKLKLGQN